MAHICSPRDREGDFSAVTAVNHSGPDDQVTQDPYCDTRSGCRKGVIVVSIANIVALMVMSAQEERIDVFSNMKLRHSAQSDAYAKGQGFGTCSFSSVAAGYCYRHQSFMSLLSVVTDLLAWKA